VVTRQDWRPKNEPSLHVLGGTVAGYQWAEIESPHSRQSFLGDRWLNQFWRSELLVDFTRELDGAGSLAAQTMRLKLYLSSLASPSGMPRLWIYKLIGDENKVETGLAQAAALVGHAIVTLRNPDEQTRKIIETYFGDFPDKVGGQFECIRNALSQKIIFVMKGEKADESLAYVQERDDNLALDAAKQKVPKHRYDSWFQKHSGGNIGFVSVKDLLFASSPSAARGGVEASVPPTGRGAGEACRNHAAPRVVSSLRAGQDRRRTSGQS